LKQLETRPGTFEFLYTNEEKRFRKNIKKNFELMKSLGWANPGAISYNINNQGFRSDFDYNNNDECNVYIGCSYTFGDSLPYESVWTTIVNNALSDYKLYNFGVLGATAVTCYRVFSSYINEIKAKRVFMLSPATNRKEMFYRGRWQTFRLGDNPFSSHAETLNTIFSYEVCLLEKTMAVDAIRGLCLQKNIPFYEINAEDKDTGDATARDLLHFGKDTHKEIANTFIKMI